MGGPEKTVPLRPVPLRHPRRVQRLQNWGRGGLIDATVDKTVFDITQGVGIGLMVKYAQEARNGMPQVVIIAGPNGAGKSTLAVRLVPRGVPFLNADDIARERAAPPGPSADLGAGRVLLHRLGEMEKTTQSFALETTLANRALAARVPRWQAAGYHVALVFVWLPSADMAVQRVAARVRAGGHSIPEATIRRRYRAGLRLFLHGYRPLVDSWRVYDNSGPQGAVLVAQGRVRARSVWQQIAKEADDGE